VPRVEEADIGVLEVEVDRIQVPPAQGEHRVYVVREEGLRGRLSAVAELHLRSSRV
jgi:hypothetical protein